MAIFTRVSEAGGREAAGEADDAIHLSVAEEAVPSTFDDWRASSSLARPLLMSVKRRGAAIPLLSLVRLVKPADNSQ